MTCSIMKPNTPDSLYFTDCDLVENGKNSGIVGYKDPACGNDNICITINQNYGKNYEVKVLNSQAWTATLRYKIRCFVGANDVKDKKSKTFEFTSTPIVCGDETITLKDSVTPVIVNELSYSTMRDYFTINSST